MKDYSILQSILGSPPFGELRFLYEDMSGKPRVPCFEGIIYAQKDAVRNSRAPRKCKSRAGCV